MYLLVAGTLFAGYFPGGLCGDTIGDILSGLEGVVSPGDPAILQVGARMLQHISISQWPILLIHLGLYFFGFYICSVYFLRKKSRVFAYLALLLSISPHLLYMHTLVVKDVFIGALWSNVLGIALLTTNKEVFRYQLRIARVIAVFLVLLSVLGRDNTFLAAPALLLMIIGPGWFGASRVGAFWKYAAVFILLLVGCVGFMRIVNQQLNTENKSRNYGNDFFVRQICSTDLIGMSILQDHSGVTAHLTSREKKYLEDIYYKRPIFWLDRDFFWSMFPRRQDILLDWKEEILNHPMIYLKHRGHLFANLFVGSPGLQMMWVSQSSDLRWVASRLGKEDEIAREYVVPDGWKNNVIYRWSRSLFSSYFETVSDTIFVGLIVFCAIVFFRTLLRMWRGRGVAQVEWIVFHAMLAAICYVMPNFFFVQHSETRYVYPALVLFFTIVLVVLEIGVNRDKESRRINLRTLFPW